MPRVLAADMLQDWKQKITANHDKLGTKLPLSNLEIVVFEMRNPMDNENGISVEKNYKCITK